MHTEKLCVGSCVHHIATVVLKAMILDNSVCRVVVNLKRQTLDKVHFGSMW